MSRTELPIDLHRRVSEILPFIAILGLLLICHLLNSAGSLQARPLWLDEFHTILVAGDPSFNHSWESLRQGADYNPPTLSILLRIYSWFAGPLDETRLRSFSWLSVCFSAAGVYVLLKETFTDSVAVAGTFATLSHPLLIHHAYDGRFYGPWFAITAWFCVLLIRQTTRPSLVTSFLLALFSGLLCTIHYFGIFSWILVMVGHFVFHRIEFSRSPKSWLGLTSGPILLAGCVLIFYRGQRAAISVPTWIVRPGFWETKDFLTQLFPAILFVIPGLISLTDRLIQERLGKSITTDNWIKGTMTHMAGATSLAFLPLILLGFSVLVQPALIERYAIPTLLCIGPVVAFSLRSVSKPMIFVSQGVFFLFALANYGSVTKSYESRQPSDIFKVIEEIRSADRHSNPPLIVSNRRETVFQVWRYATDLQDFLAILDTTDPRFGEVNNLEQLERDVAVRLHELYKTPRMIQLDEASKVDIIYLVTSQEDTAKIADQFPDFKRQTVFENKISCLRLSRIQPERRK